MLFNRHKQYAYLMRLNKPIGIFLLLWPTLWALWLASNGHPHFMIVAIFILGVILMRSAGCVINDIADRHIDAHVERTRLRPLATGTVNVTEALSLFGIVCFLAFILVLQLNNVTIFLACVGVIIVIIYPFMKRFTHLPQLGLGVAFAWSVPMAYAATTGTIPNQSWVLFLAGVVWPVIYDTMYAMVDRADDIQIGMKSTAILFSQYDREIIAVLQCTFLILLLWVGVLFQLHWPYYLSLIIAAVLLGYQQQLIKDRVRENCFKAFLNNHWVGLVIFVGILLSYTI